MFCVEGGEAGEQPSPKSSGNKNGGFTMNTTPTTTDKAAMSFDTVNLSASRKNIADKISEKIGVENMTAIASPNGAFRTAW